MAGHSKHPPVQGSTGITSAPLEAMPELASEAALLEGMLHESEYGDMSRAAKWTSSDATTKSHTRGRKRSTGTR